MGGNKVKARKTALLPLFLLVPLTGCMDEVADVLDEIEDFIDDLDFDHHHDDGYLTIIIGDDDDYYDDCDWWCDW